MLVPDANLDVGGSDNTAALQQLLDAGRPIPPGVYGVAGTLRVNPAVGRDVAGAFGGVTGPDAPDVGTWLVWQGPAGGTLLDLRGIKCRVRDLGLACARSTSLDRAVDVETPSGPPSVSSQHLFENLAVWGYGGPIRCGVVVGEDDLGNHDFMAFRDCSFRYCTYAGVSCPNSTRQAKSWAFTGCSFGGPAQYGVVFNSGSASFSRCNFDAVGRWVKWFGAALEPVIFESCTGENCVGGPDTGGAAVSVFRGCRFHLGAARSPQPLGDEWLIPGRDFLIDGCTWEEADNLAGFIRPRSGARGVVRACSFHSALPLSADDKTGWIAGLEAVRVNQQNDLLPAGTYWQREPLGFVWGPGPTLVPAVHYPPPLAYSGGAPYLVTP